LAALRHPGRVFGDAFSPDSRTLATAMNRKAGNTVRLWDVATGRERIALKGHAGGSALFVTFTPNGKCLLSAGEAGTIKVWDATTGRRLAEFESEAAGALAQSGPDARAAFPVLFEALANERWASRSAPLDKVWPLPVDQAVLASQLAEALRHDHPIIRS